MIDAFVIVEWRVKGEYQRNNVLFKIKDIDFFFCLDRKTRKILNWLSRCKGVKRFLKN